MIVGCKQRNCNFFSFTILLLSLSLRSQQLSVLFALTMLIQDDKFHPRAQRTTRVLFRLDIDIGEVEKLEEEAQKNKNNRRRRWLNESCPSPNQEGVEDKRFW
ncbi:MAG: hypothetical protein NXY57DRAFT_1004614 [Lentinula lateritia]|nr:MAG: hypothetical protein NXY57DRAFT_1004614 [Lentinula lateritia]